MRSCYQQLNFGDPVWRAGPPGARRAYRPESLLSKPEHPQAICDKDTMNIPDLFQIIKKI